MRRQHRAEIVKTIYDSLTQLVEPGTVVELRIPKVDGKKRTDSGYFDDLETAARCAADYDGRAPGVYFTLNPVDRVLLARAANRIQEWAELTTSDEHITQRRWLPIDCDPKVNGKQRPAGISSTEVEHLAALRRAQEIREWLTLVGWPKPILADSGNGGALLYRIDLPNDDTSTNLIKHCLAALALEFDDPAVEIDTSVFNAGRIWKVYGTLAGKGDSTTERPHRRAQILELPQLMQPVTLDLLRPLARRLPKEPPHDRRHARGGSGTPGIDNIGSWLRQHNLSYRIKDVTLHGGPATLFILDACPFNSDHRDARITQFANGAVAFGCFHNSCQLYDWQALREKFEPGYQVEHDGAGDSGQVSEPSFDKEGLAYCPNCGKRLHPAKNGNGWRCLKEDGTLCFWWQGEDDQAPADQQPNNNTATPLLLTPIPSARCPELPAAAQLGDTLPIGACAWLDQYIAFSRHWAPDAYEDMHEAVGLWVLATTAARRVYLPPSYYTNLYIALCARSSLFTKTTVARIGVDTIQEAGLAPLLLPDDTTPEAFIRGLTQKVPKGFAEMNNEQRAFVRQRLAFAGQRSWFYDEFGMKLSAMMRENGTMTDFRGLLRIFDDNKPSYERETISRAIDFVRQPYLSLLANLTPADLRPYAKQGSPLWSDGFLARFALITPPPDAAATNERFPDAEFVIPDDMLQPLSSWHQRLGIPEVTINERADEAGKGTGSFDVTVEALPMQRCRADQAVFDAFYAYRGALKTLIGTLESDDVDASYARLPVKAMRVALLFASLENDGHVELRHWARAQQITERWRANLHHLIDQLQSSRLANRPAELGDRVLSTLTRLGQATLRDLHRYLKHIDEEELEQLLENLAHRGLIAKSRTRSNTARYSIQDPNRRTVELSNCREERESSTPSQEAKLQPTDETDPALSTARHIDSSTAQSATGSTDDALDDDLLVLRIQERAAEAAFEEAFQLAARLQSVSKQQKMVAKLEQDRAIHEQVVAQISEGWRGPAVWKSDDFDFPVLVLGLWDGHTVKVRTMDGHLASCPTIQTEFIGPESPYYETALSISSKEDDLNDLGSGETPPISPTVEMLDDPFISIPPGLRVVLRLYLRSSKVEDQNRARELCGEYGLDYETARAIVYAKGDEQGASSTSDETMTGEIP